MDDLQVATKQARHDWVICSGPSDPARLHAHHQLAPDRLSPCEPAGLTKGVDAELEDFEACPSGQSPFYSTTAPTPLKSLDGKSPRMAASEMGLSCHQPEHSTLVARRSFAQG